ncbi:hypothetical protein GFS31_03040 [Leptolyngbya sp. BL0902]|nr:hypothetical protein GFS31_03040 [Leptolyngbya sp. BL0902]
MPQPIPSYVIKSPYFQAGFSGAFRYARFRDALTSGSSSVHPIPLSPP